MQLRLCLLVALATLHVACAAGELAVELAGGDGSAATGGDATTADVGGSADAGASPGAGDIGDAGERGAGGAGGADGGGVAGGGGADGGGDPEGGADAGRGADAGSDGPGVERVGDAGLDGSAGEPGDPPCPGGGLEPGDHTLSLTHEGVDYNYLVHVPPRYDPTVRTPLVLNWHGLTSNAWRQRDFSAMDPVADAHNFIVVYPDSPDTSWNAGACCHVFVLNRDDVGFAVALVEEMATQACIDDRRVYSTGFSNGGYMSHRLACERADVFAAVAPVAGTVSVPECNPSRPIPIIHFHGTADNNVRYEGGGFARADSVPHTLQAWAGRNGCAPEPIVTFSLDDATCETWTDCDGGAEVRLCSFDGVGHCWPGQALCRHGTATTTLDASEEAAVFFERFHL